LALQIKILAIGKAKKSYLAKGIADFLERLSHFARVEIIELKEPKKSGRKPARQIIATESEILQAKLQPGEFVIALDRKGEMPDSPGLADFLQQCMNENKNPLVFVIGGELGLDAELLHKADKILSLSKLTFTHDMTRLILLEQLYRAFTILAGQKYHK
jgi:23S rRNA (pseudouridine1915-N3)-methyltransferase